MKKILSLGISFIFVIASLGNVSANSFTIEEIEVTQSDVIELIFTRELDNSLTAVREFILENTQTMIEIQVLLSDIDPNDPTRLTLVLDSFLEENTDYTITVLDINDKDGNTIEVWIDSIFTFNTGTLSIWQADAGNGASTQEDDILEQEEDMQTETQIDEEITESFEDDPWLENLNSAPNEGQVVEDRRWGTTLSSNEMESSTLVHAENSESLPDTGPEIILLILMTLLMTGWVVYVKNRRIS